jgi:hypothetical protein
MSKINQPEVDRLCAHYSAASADRETCNRRRDKIEELLDAEMAGMQKHFRRKLSAAIKGSQSTVMRSRVWALVAHGKTPVTITPIASATILVRKGVEIHLSFVATEGNISAETGRLKAAIAALNNP